MKGDDSLRSFLFTLRNPHGVPARKFALKEEMMEYAIYCNSAYCVAFGHGDIAAYDSCNTSRDSCTHICTRWSSSPYANDTAFGDFLTGAEEFTVKEIQQMSRDARMGVYCTRDEGAGAAGRL
jgi:hypothetical protein